MSAFTLYQVHVTSGVHDCYLYWMSKAAPLSSNVYNMNTFLIIILIKCLAGAKALAVHIIISVVGLSACCNPYGSKDYSDGDLTTWQCSISYSDILLMMILLFTIL